MVKRLLGRRALVGLALAALVAAAAVGASGPTVNQQIRKANAPDLILYNGLITTQDDADSTVKAIAIRDGVIIASDDQNGRIKALADTGTQVVNLNGRRVLPGLIDGHLHGMREGYHCWTQVVRLDLVTSRATALTMYAAKAAELADGRWIWTTAAGGTSTSSTCP
jgi:predicted amidohydrolase YtcJ